MSIDYRKLGGEIGTAWRATHPQQGYNHTDRMRVYRQVSNLLGIDGTIQAEVMREPMMRTMQGQCYGCGTDHEVGRGAEGVLCCEVCVGR